MYSYVAYVYNLIIYGYYILHSVSKSLDENIENPRLMYVDPEGLEFFIMHSHIISSHLLFFSNLQATVDRYFELNPVYIAAKRRM